MNKRSGALHLTQKVDYGIMLLACLGKLNKNESKSIKIIAKENNLAFPFLQKIAGILNKSGLIYSERGKYGGYKLSKSPQKLSLTEIIEALEGPIALAPCLKRSLTGTCSCSGTCEVKRNFMKLNQEIEKCFSTKTLDYFIN